MKRATIYLICDTARAGTLDFPYDWWRWALEVHGMTGSAGEHRGDRRYTSKRGARQAAQRYAKGLGCDTITFADTATIPAVSGVQA